MYSSNDVTVAYPDDVKIRTEILQRRQCGADVETYLLEYDLDLPEARPGAAATGAEERVLVEPHLVVKVSPYLELVIPHGRAFSPAFLAALTAVVADDDGWSERPISSRPRASNTPPGVSPSV